jgi:YbbR domain-containing protein
MDTLRSILFHNLGLKFTALLLAVLVYLNVYTDRPTTMLVAFPLRYVELGDSLAIHGAAPSVVEAELSGTGKQLILLRVQEPALDVSLASARMGRFERSLSPSDLPLPPQAGVSVVNLIGPRVVSLEIDRKVTRELPLEPRISGMPASGYTWRGRSWVRPERVRVTGPEQAVIALDTLALAALRVDGRHDTVSAVVAPEGLPEGCIADPPTVRVQLLLERRPR